MTIIVWDGEQLATDCAATDDISLWETIKAWHWADDRGDVVLSGAGPLASILAMREWYKDGAIPAYFPPEQSGESFCHFLVVTRDGLLRYEQSPHPIEHGITACAFGEGKQFAYGALAMGADAETAVAIANSYSAHCGLGVKVYKPGGGA